MSDAATQSGMRRVLVQVIAVKDLDSAVVNYTRLGFRLARRSVWADWGLEAALFDLDDGSHIELITPADLDKPGAKGVQGFLDKKGDGPFVTSIEVDDVFGYYEKLVADGVKVLGPPTPSAPEVGWDCDFFWVDPKATNGACLEF